MNKIDKLEIQILGDLLNDLKEVNPEFVIEHIEERIDIIKYGI